MAARDISALPFSVTFWFEILNGIYNYTNDILPRKYNIVLIVKFSMHASSSEQRSDLLLDDKKYTRLKLKIKENKKWCTSTSNTTSYENEPSVPNTSPSKEQTLRQN